MARKQRVSRGKIMRPNYFVFCEGETEEAHVGILRAHYRAPIQINLKSAELQLSRKYSLHACLQSIRLKALL